MLHNIQHRCELLRGLWAIRCVSGTPVLELWLKVLGYSQSMHTRLTQIGPIPIHGFRLFGVKSCALVYKLNLPLPGLHTIVPSADIERHCAARRCFGNQLELRNGSCLSKAIGYIWTCSSSRLVLGLFSGYLKPADSSHSLVSEGSFYFLRLCKYSVL